MAVTSANPTKAGRGQPGVYIVIRPREKSYGIIRRVARYAATEHTAKDFWDFFGNVGVLLGFGPATEELIGEDGAWLELVPLMLRGKECVAEVFTGAKAGQKFLLVFVLDRDETANLAKWKQLLEKIIGRFF